MQVVWIGNVFFKRRKTQEMKRNENNEQKVKTNEKNEQKLKKSEKN